MKFLKENPIFSILLIVLLLAFAAGAWLDYSAYEKSEKHEKQETAAEADLRRSLALSPAPTKANKEAAEANVAALKESLRQQIQTTKGTKPELINSNVPSDGTELLFQLRGYREQLEREARQQIPINVNEKSVEEGNVSNPGVKLPDNFAFGFSRYLHRGVPPRADEVAQVYLQKQVLEYIVGNLLDTRPIEIKAVQRETKEAAAAPAGSGRPGRPAGGSQQQGPSDEFHVGASSIAVKDAVSALGFKVVFTGYTENLRLFMKAIEEFELPLVVRSVAVKPLESSVRTQQTGTANRGTSNLSDLFGTAETIDLSNQAQIRRAQEPVVAENISEFTVVIEYITVTLKNAN